MPRYNKMFGLVGSTLGGTLYVDYSSDEKLENTVNDLTEKIMTIVQTPLNKRFSNISNSSVGAVVTSYDDDSAVILQNLQSWLRKVDITPKNALKYAEKMMEKGVPTIEKLRRLVKKKGKVCLTSMFGIDEIDEDGVYDALMVEEKEKLQREKEEREGQQKLLKDKQEKRKLIRYDSDIQLECCQCRKYGWYV
jgi:hypothetical protein